MDDQILKSLDEINNKSRLMARGYHSRLMLMKQFNWLTVILPAIVAYLIGTALFGGVFKEPVESSISNIELIGWLAIMMAGALPVIHKSLKCDEYQAECHRMVQLYQSIAFDCNQARHLRGDELKLAMSEVESRVSEAIQSVTITLPKKYLDGGF